MKCSKIILLIMISAFAVSLLSACGKERSAELVNELSFSLDGIEDLVISYDEENISFFESENDNLIVREYMSEDKKAYYAKVSENKDHIQISEGGKPSVKSRFTRYVEVYLPMSYSENLEITTTDGDIDLTGMEIDLKLIRVDCTSGNFRLKKAEAENIYFSTTSGKLELGSIAGDQIKIESTSGEVSCERAEGNVVYTSTSGNAEFKSVSGLGIYETANSGKMSVVYDEVSGDLFFFNKNDDIEVVLPAALSFEFEALTKNGSVRTDFQEALSVDGDLTSGSVGSDPTVNIKLETKNGNIEVNR